MFGGLSITCSVTSFNIQCLSQRLPPPPPRAALSLFYIECVFAGANGTHSDSVCTVHQNVKLMSEGGTLVAPTDGLVTDYKDCLAAIV